MGDHRASIKIEMQFHGKTEKTDMWINWSPDSSECDGIDQRIIDWFRDVSSRGYVRYTEEMHDYHKERIAREEREAELATLKRLKLK